MTVHGSLWNTHTHLVHFTSSATNKVVAQSSRRQRPDLKEVPVSFRAQCETGCVTSFCVRNDIP